MQETVFTVLADCVRDMGALVCEPAWVCGCRIVVISHHCVDNRPSPSCTVS